MSKRKTRQVNEVMRLMARLGVTTADLVANDLQTALGGVVEYCTGITDGVPQWAERPVATTKEEAERYADNWLDEFGDAVCEQITWRGGESK